MISISNTYILLCRPLLGLELTTTENVEELDPKPEADSFESSLNPLLGTTLCRRGEQPDSTAPALCAAEPWRFWWRLMGYDGPS
jgi:hypothetical protein